MKRNNTLPLLLALAVGLGGLGLYLSKAREGRMALSGQDRPLVEGLNADINTVTGLKLSGPGNTLVADLQRTDKGWVVANKDAYPADLGKIRELLLKLADSNLREEKTANPERHALLGVEDLESKDAKGVGVEVIGLKAPVKLIVGTFSTTGGQGHFVRIADQPQSWLASGSIRPDLAESAWLQTEVVNIGSPRMRRVEITPPTGAKVVIEKTDSAAPDYAVLDLPKGRELSSVSVANGISTLLDNLRLEDVAEATADRAQPDPVALYQTRFLTGEGVLVKVDGWEREGKNWLRLSAELDPTRSEQWLLEEQIKAEAAAKPAAAAVPAVADSTATTAAPAAATAAPTTPAEITAAPAAFDTAKFREERLAPLNQEIAELNARTNGWVYAVPTWKFANIKKSMDDLLKPKDAAK